MSDKIQGFATPEGTKRFKDRFEGSGKVAEGHFKTGPGGLYLSSLGMGSYLGNPDPSTDARMTEAAKTSIQSGAVNVIDSAINYRFQCSERSLGVAVRQLVESGAVARDELFLCSKNGFLTPDAAVKKDFREYFTETFITPGIVDPADIAGGMHCMSPGYLDHQLNQSLGNMGVETLDLMYLHNAVESQLPEVGEAEFLKRLEAAFAFYEKARQEGRMRYYGLATWSCFRTTPDNTEEYMALEKVVKLAQSIGGKDTHGFRFVQLPFNLAMPEALVLANQPVEGRMATMLGACQAFGIGVFGSVPLLQGQLLQGGGPQLEGLETGAQVCLQFVRSTPGMLAPLVGHKQAPHVEDNLKVAKVPPLSLAQFDQAFLKQDAPTR